MFEILPESTEKCIGFKISGEVEAEDYEVLLPILDVSYRRTRQNQPAGSHG